MEQKEFDYYMVDKNSNTFQLFSALLCFDRFDEICIDVWGIIPRKTISVLSKYERPFGCAYFFNKIIFKLHSYVISHQNTEEYLEKCSGIDFEVVSWGITVESMPFVLAKNQKEIGISSNSIVETFKIKETLDRMLRKGQINGYEMA